MMQKRMKERLLIFVDDREVRSNVIDEFEAYSLKIRQPINIVIKRLEEGDYICGDNMIERIDVREFKNKLVDGRLETQLQKYTTVKHKCTMIVVGDGEKKVRIGGKMIPIIDGRTRKAMVTMLAKYNSCGITALQLKNTREFVQYCMRLFMYDIINKPKYKIVSNIPKNEETTIRMLMGIQGIGQELATLITEKFKSMEELVHASVEDLALVTSPKTGSVGKNKNVKMARLIYQALRNGV